MTPTTPAGRVALRVEQPALFELIELAVELMAYRIPKWIMETVLKLATCDAWEGRTG